jgi:hypothetical protein
MPSGDELEVRFIWTVGFPHHEKAFPVLLWTMSVCCGYIGFSSYELCIEPETWLFSLRNNPQITFSHFNCSWQSRATSANSTRIPQSCYQPPNRTEVPTEGVPSLKEITRMVLARFEYLGQEREVHLHNRCNRLNIHFSLISSKYA